MNILIKLMSIVSLVIAPTLASMFHTQDDTGMTRRAGTGKSAIVHRTILSNKISSPEKTPGTYLHY
jgi:hypothetical protein